VKEINAAALAEQYYKQVGKKNIEEVKKFFHPDVELFGPLATLKGKEAVTQATINFMNLIESLNVRAAFGLGHQAMIVHDSDIPGIAKGFPGAVLLSFQEGLIIRLELFYDSKRLIEKRDEIFSKK
jgi:ketosteroid isomerase-like protein